MLPPPEVIGVAALAQSDIVIEIVAVAALPDLRLAAPTE
jgi:hypothetical protein